MNVITGETGAGKTMVVTGLGLLFGGRADAARVRSEPGRAVVEGRLRLAGPGAASVTERVVEAGAGPGGGGPGPPPPPAAPRGPVPAPPGGPAGPRAGP